jgi:hypothetical protein
MTHVTIAPHVLVRNIHQSAWKGNSAKFGVAISGPNPVELPANFRRIREGYTTPTSRSLSSWGIVIIAACPVGSSW